MTASGNCNIFSLNNSNYYKVILLNIQLLRKSTAPIAPVCLPVFSSYFLIALILFCSARKRQGNNSQTARFIYFNHICFLSYCSCFGNFLCKCVLSV